MRITSAILLTLAILFASCSDNDNNNVDPSPEPDTKNADGYYGDVRSVKIYLNSGKAITLPDGTHRVEATDTPILSDEYQYNDKGIRKLWKSYMRMYMNAEGEYSTIITTNIYDDKGRLIEDEYADVRMGDDGKITKYYERSVIKYDINESKKEVTESFFTKKNGENNSDLEEMPYQVTVKNFKDHEMTILEREKLYVQKKQNTRKISSLSSGVANTETQFQRKQEEVYKKDQKNNPLIRYYLTTTIGSEPANVTHQLRNSVFYSYIYEYADGTQSTEKTQTSIDEWTDGRFIAHKASSFNVLGDVKYFEKIEYWATEGIKQNIDDFSETEVVVKNEYTFGEDGYLNKLVNYTWNINDLKPIARLYRTSTFETDVKGRTTATTLCSNLSQPKEKQTQTRYIIKYDDVNKTATIQFYQKDGIADEKLISIITYAQTKEKGYVNNYVVIKQEAINNKTRTAHTDNESYINEIKPEEDMQLVTDKEFITKYDSKNNKLHEYTWVKQNSNNPSESLEGITVAYKWTYNYR